MRAAAIATGKGVSEGNTEIFLRAIGCNWLVCLAVWMAYSAEDIGGKILAIFFPIMAFVAMGFDHVVANMFFLLLGHFFGPPELGWDGFTRNLVIAFLGNLAGAAVFVGGVFWPLILRGTPAEADGDIAVAALPAATRFADRRPATAGSSRHRAAAPLAVRRRPAVARFGRPPPPPAPATSSAAHDGRLAVGAALLLRRRARRRAPPGRRPTPSRRPWPAVLGRVPRLPSAGPGVRLGRGRPSRPRLVAVHGGSRPACEHRDPSARCSCRPAGSSSAGPTTPTCGSTTRPCRCGTRCSTWRRRRT